MSSQASALYKLQQVDLQIIRHGKRLGEIDLLLKDSQAVQDAQKQVEDAQARLKPLRTTMQTLEFDIQSNTQKAKSTEERLYSGTVKNPKEMRDMQQEIASLKKRHEELENELLEQMMYVEAAETELKTCQQKLLATINEWESQHSDLIQERDKLNTEVEKLQGQRQQAVQHVTKESLKIYNSLKAKKANQPVALLKGNSCGVCGIEQTVAIRQE